MNHEHVTNASQDSPATAELHETTFQRAKPIALGLILALLAVVGLRLLVELQHVLILCFLAVLFGSAISQPRRLWNDTESRAASLSSWCS